MSKHQIQRYKTAPVLAFATDPNSIETAAIPLNGLLKGIIFTVPTLGGGATATVNVKDVDGNVIYTKAGVSSASTHKAFVDTNNQPLELPLSGNHTIEIVTSADQAANRTFGVVLLIQRG